MSLAEKRASKRAVDERSPAALAVVCRTCGAAVGARCTNRRTDKPCPNHNTRRVDAYRGFLASASAELGGT